MLSGGKTGTNDERAYNNVEERNCHPSCERENLARFLFLPNTRGEKLIR